SGRRAAPAEPVDADDAPPSRVERPPGSNKVLPPAGPRVRVARRDVTVRGDTAERADDRKRFIAEALVRDVRGVERTTALEREGRGQVTETRARRDRERGAHRATSAELAVRFAAANAAISARSARAVATAPRPAPTWTRAAPSSSTYAYTTRPTGAARGEPRSISS